MLLSVVQSSVYCKRLIQFHSSDFNDLCMQETAKSEIRDVLIHN